LADHVAKHLADLPYPKIGRKRMARLPLEGTIAASIAGQGGFCFNDGKVKVMLAQRSIRR
jgi:hypothetical protein